MRVARRVLGGVGVLTIGFSALPALAQAPPTVSPPPPTPVGAEAAANSPAARDAVVTLTRVCLPVLEGQDLKSEAAAAGFQQENGAWTLALGGARRIVLTPPDTANPHVCSATIAARPGAGVAELQALADWAGSQRPPLAPVESNVVRDQSGEEWTTSSWSAQTPKGVESVVLTREAPTSSARDGGRLSQSQLLVTVAPT